MPSVVEVEPCHVTDVLNSVPTGPDKTEPCYRSALHVSKTLARMGVDSRLVYAGGHCVSQVLLSDGLYYANSFHSASNLIKAPDNPRTRFGFDTSGQVGFLTTTPDHDNILAIEAAEHSELTTDTDGPIIHSMTIDEAETVFGAFETANQYRSEYDFDRYCREVINNLEGRFVPLMTIYGYGLSGAATEAIAIAGNRDRGLGQAAITAIANTSVVPQITEIDLALSVQNISR